MKVCRMCWALLDDQLNKCDCAQGADPSVFFKDVQEMVNHFVSQYRKENKQLKEDYDIQWKVTQDFRLENINLKQKLEKIKIFFAQYTVENGEFTRVNVNKLKEILQPTKDWKS